MEVSTLVKSNCLLGLFNLAGDTSPAKARELGLPENLLHQIQNLTNREMTKLATSYSTAVVDITINIDMLAMLVGNIKGIEEERNLAIEFVKRDASMPLMEKLFGLGALEFTSLRKAVELPVSKGGKPRCSVEERLDILVAWDEHSGLDERERYLTVADTTGMSLRSVHMVVMQREADLKSNALVSGEQRRGNSNDR